MKAGAGPIEHREFFDVPRSAVVRVQPQAGNVDQSRYANVFDAVRQWLVEDPEYNERVGSLLDDFLAEEPLSLRVEEDR